MTTALCLGVEQSAPTLPLELRWEDELPVRSVRALVGCKGSGPGLEAPPWLNTGRHDEPFDFCDHIRRLCHDLVARCDVLRHIDVGLVLLGITQARKGRRGGLQARVTPLRCRGGRLTRLHQGVCYQVQRYFVREREMLYLLTFCLPRFLDQSFDDKFITIFHELYHINPAFDGDLRRHDGRGVFHTRSKREYDHHMAHLARAYLASKPESALHDFLRLNFAQLQHRHGSVVGIVVPRPKLLPLIVPAAARTTSAVNHKS